MEIKICLNGTGGSGQEYLYWKAGRLHALRDTVREQIDRWLAPVYETQSAPHIDIDTLSGTSGAWLPNDCHACNSRNIEFTLILLPDEIKIRNIAIVEP